jgi:hypothetical protein
VSLRTSKLLLRVISGNAHNEPMMSAFHPIATEQRTQFYVCFLPEGDKLSGNVNLTAEVPISACSAGRV